MDFNGCVPGAEFGIIIVSYFVVIHECFIAFILHLSDGLILSDCELNISNSTLVTLLRSRVLHDFSRYIYEYFHWKPPWYGQSLIFFSVMLK